MSSATRLYSSNVHTEVSLLITWLRVCMFVEEDTLISSHGPAELACLFVITVWLLSSAEIHTHTHAHTDIFTHNQNYIWHTHTLTQSLTDTHIIHILHTHLHPGQQCADCSLCTAIVLQRDLGRGCELSIRGHFTMNAKAVQFINSMPFVKLTRNWVKIVSK